eukprot:6778884-Lingulodinium_polyedra.AAC.1
MLKDCGGMLTLDSACSRSVGGQAWYQDLKKRLLAAGCRPIEYPEREPFRFGASKTIYSTVGALIPCAVGGAGFT